LLLDRGADLMARGKGGETPLHLAAFGNKTAAVVELLLERGANPKARDGKGKVPFEYAEGNEALENSDVYRRLKKEAH